MVLAKELPKLGFSLNEIVQRNTLVQTKTAKKCTLGQIRSPKMHFLGGRTSPFTMTIDESPAPLQNRSKCYTNLVKCDTSARGSRVKLGGMFEWGVVVRQCSGHLCCLRSTLPKYDVVIKVSSNP